jgi:hypothetical protein
VPDVSTHFYFCFLFGDLVSGPQGSIPGPGEGLLRGSWTPPNIRKSHIFVIIGFGTMEVTKPYEFTGFGAMDVTKTL